MTAAYITPGMPPPPPPATQPNTYRPPAGSPQDSSWNRAAAHPATAHRRSATACAAGGTRPNSLLAEWRHRHGSDWVRADELHPAIRCMIDPRERLPAVRQKLRQLVATCRELEVKVVGNAARPVALYRIVKSEVA